MVSKIRKAWVVDDDGNIIIYAGDVGPEVTKADDLSSYVVISYWNSVENSILGKPKIVKIFPLNRVYYGYLEEN